MENNEDDLFLEARTPEFEKYINRIRNGTATKIDHEEFHMRLMQRFCIQVYENKPVEPWIMEFFADAYTRILFGGQWNDEVQLPWVPVSQIRKRAEDRDLKVYCEVEGILRKNSNEKVTDLIESAALNNCCSYEVARAGYYKIKKIILKMDGHYKKE